MTTFAVHIDLVGAHAHARVFVGPHEGARGLAGTLVMSPEEAEALRNLLDRAPGQLVQLRSVIAGASKVMLDAMAYDRISPSIMEEFVGALKVEAKP